MLDNTESEQTQDHLINEENIDPVYLFSQYFSLFKDLLWKDDFYLTKKPKKEDTNN